MVIELLAETDLSVRATMAVFALPVAELVVGLPPWRSDATAWAEGAEV